MSSYKQMGVLQSHSTLEPTVVGMPDWSRAIDIVESAYCSENGWTASEAGWVYGFGLANGYLPGCLALIPVDNPSIHMIVLQHAYAGDHDDNSDTNTFLISPGDRLYFSDSSGNPHTSAVADRTPDPRHQLYFVPFKKSEPIQL